MNMNWKGIQRSNIECDREIQKIITDENELERDLEISNIECDRVIQKIITDETGLERDLDESLEFSLKIKRYKKRLENVLQQQNKSGRRNFN